MPLLFLLTAPLTGQYPAGELDIMRLHLAGFDSIAQIESHLKEFKVVLPLFARYYLPDRVQGLGKRQLIRAISVFYVVFLKLARENSLDKLTELFEAATRHEAKTHTRVKILAGSSATNAQRVLDAYKRAKGA